MKTSHFYLFSTLSLYAGQTIEGEFGARSLNLPDHILWGANSEFG